MPQTQALPGTTAYMYGVNSFYDGPCSSPYDPWIHAEALGAKIVSNMTLPDDTPAAYSPDLNIIFFRADLPEDVERCAIAHELVHFEHQDQPDDPIAEARADRISTLRLIRPSDIEDLMFEVNDMHQLAIELRVTEQVLSRYAEMKAKGTLPQN